MFAISFIQSLINDPAAKVVKLCEIVVMVPIIIVYDHLGFL